MSGSVITAIVPVGPALVYATIMRHLRDGPRDSRSLGDARRAEVTLASRRVALPHDPFSQDWEREVADHSRFGEFLDAYESGGLDEDERFALMAILIQCIEDMGLPSVESSPQWHSVANLLRAHAGLHASSVRYWSCLEDRDLEDCFRVTGPMRAVWDLIRRSDDELSDASQH